jgi:hypothetical protein
VLLLFLPHLHPVPFTTPIPDLVANLRLMTPVHEQFLSNRSWNVGIAAQGVISGLLGWSAGVLCGGLFTLVRWLITGARPESSAESVTLGLCGVFLGWQMAVGIAAAVGLLECILSLMKRWHFESVITSSDIVWMTSLSLLLTWRSTNAVLEQFRLFVEPHVVGWNIVNH